MGENMVGGRLAGAKGMEEEEQEEEEVSGRVEAMRKEEHGERWRREKEGGGWKRRYGGGREGW